MAKGKGRPRKSGARTPSGQLSRAGKRERGSLGTRLAHARPLLTDTDRRRLDMLCTMSPRALVQEGIITPDKSGTKDIDLLVAFEREALFTKAANAANAAQRKDPIGRAWHDGLLDGHGVDPIRLREVGREYGYLYWHEYAAVDATIGGYTEMLGRGSVAFASKDPEQVRDAAGKRWQAYSAIVDPMGFAIRTALHRLCVDDIWSLDGPAWLDRVINTHRAVKRLNDGDTLHSSATDELSRRGDTETLRLAILALVKLANGDRWQRQAAQAKPAPTAPSEPLLVSETAPLKPIDPDFLDNSFRMRSLAEIAETLRARIAPQAQVE